MERSDKRVKKRGNFGEKNRIIIMIIIIIIMKAGE